MSATTDQRFEALAHANKVFRDRARLKADLKSGAVSPVDVLACPPPCLHPVWVFDFLCWSRRPGRQRGVARDLAADWLWKLEISESRPVGELTARQRDELIALLGSR